MVIDGGLDAHPAFESVSDGSFSEDPDGASIGMYHDPLNQQHSGY